MLSYLRYVFVLVPFVTLFQFSDCFLENVTVVECEIPCNISCYYGQQPFKWMYRSTLEENWKTLDKYTTQDITVNEDMINYYYRCSTEPPNIFYVVGKKELQQPPSSDALTAVIVLAVLFGIGFLIMVALWSLKYYRGRASHTVDEGVTIRDRTPDEVCRPIRQSSVDVDGYIIPLNQENRDSDYLEVMGPTDFSNNARSRTLSCGPLYENLENMRKTRVSTNHH